MPEHDQVSLLSHFLQLYFSCSFTCNSQGPLDPRALSRTVRWARTDLQQGARQHVRLPREDNTPGT